MVEDVTVTGWKNVTVTGWENVTKVVSYGVRNQCGRRCCKGGFLTCDVLAKMCHSSRFI